MYRYYQTKEKGKWSPLRDSDKSVKAALEEGAKKVTVLAVSEVVDEYTVKDQLSYKGPLYFDIDCKDDLYMAIKSARELLAKLLKHGVHRDCIAVYCSGSKGLHLMVDARAFSTGRAVKGLPFIYKAMAKSLYVFGLDYQVYSGGRGNSWRVVNLQRDDGNYRVGISHEELDSLTPETYKEYVKGPRLAHEFPAKVETGHALLLSSLYDKCKQEVQKQQRDFSKNQKMALDEELLSAIKGKAPACIDALLEGRVKTELNFNEVVLQMAAYLSSTGASESVINSMSSRLSEKMSSSQYGSARERYQHAIGLVHYCKSSRAYKFSCPAIKRVLTANPCEGCAVNSRKTDSQLAAEEGDIGISARDDGYYVIGGDNDRRISTFTLDILDFHAEQQQDGSVDRRTGFRALVNSKGLNCADRAEIFMSEDMWNSKAALIRELNGLGAIAFLGTDVDVQRVKHYVFSQQASSEAGQITAVYTAGILSQKVGKQDLMVYVEPSGSINQVKVQNTHYLNASNMMSPPRLLEESMPSSGDEALISAIDALFRFNSDLNLAILIGWYTASHFRTHFIKEYNQFPSLNLWGPAGSGKTMTAVQMAWLGGCDYTAEHSPMNVAEATHWPLVEFCSSTTTAPRILDEANETKMPRGKYVAFSEIIKSAFGNQTVTRGTLRKSGSSGQGRTGAQTITIPISAPIVYLSEQSPTMPAMVQRSIQAFLTRESRAGHECTAAFNTLTKYRKKLASLGKAVMVHALTSPSRYARGLIDKHVSNVPEQFEDRPRFSYAVVLSGLEVFQEVCGEFGIDVSSRISVLEKALKDHLQESMKDIMIEKSRTEIDLILQDMAVMASLTQSGMSKELVEDIHYMIHNDSFVLDYRTAFPLYTQYCARARKDVVIRDIRQFHALIRQEPYFEQEGMVVGFLNRPTMVLSKSGMLEKGIDVSMFSLSSEVPN